MTPASEAVNRIRDGTITDYTYDPKAAALLRTNGLDAALAQPETTAGMFAFSMGVRHLVSLSRAVNNFGFSEIPLDAYPKSPIHPSPSRPTKGRIRIVRDAGRDAVDAAASGVKRGGRAGPQGFVSDQTAR